MTPRLLTGARPDRPMTRTEHRALHGWLPAPGKKEARDLLARLDGGLRGRGGAGFPVVRKLAAALDVGGRGCVVVNATEGEPASLKDKALVGAKPHLVLDGAQLAARATKAKEVVVAVHEGSGLREVLTTALAERPDDVVRTRLLEVPEGYLSGEASALARAAAGEPALPALRPVPMAVRGPGGRPTVVSNAESLAGLALLHAVGPTAYAAVGMPDEPGTVLVTVRSSSTRPRVLEVPLGTPVGAVLEGVTASAVLLGGYFGSWLPAPAALDVPLSHAGARAAGGSLGAGMVLALGPDECGLRATAHAVRYLADHSARQCGPCANGLPAIAGALEALVGGFAAPDVLDHLSRWCGLVEGRGLCALPDGATVLVRSALEVFAEDVAAHAADGCGRPAGSALAVPGRAA